MTTILLALGGVEALGSEAPPVVEAAEVAAEPAEEPPLRTLNSGFGLGVAHLGSLGNPSRHRAGLLLDLRSESALSKRFQFNFLFSAGVTTPENAVALFGWGTDAGRSITAGFGSVSRWAAGRRGDDPLEAFRQMGALFAYMGLGMSYVVVPLAWMTSPLAAVGHVITGPTVSFHTGPEAPDGWVELGVGGVLYGDPVSRGPRVGYGPMLGAGAHVGKRSVGLRFLLSPPGAHTDSDEGPDTVISASFVVGL